MADEEGAPTNRNRMSVEFKQATVVTGCWTQHPRGAVGVAIHTSVVEFQGRNIEFVPVVFNDNWVLRVVVGEGAVEGHCRDSQIVETIREKLKMPAVPSRAAVIN